MKVEEFVSSHIRVRHPRSDVAVIISVFAGIDRGPGVDFTPDEIMDNEYKDCVVKAWYQTLEATDNGVLTNILILI